MAWFFAEIAIDWFLKFWIAEGSEKEQRLEFADLCWGVPRGDHADHEEPDHVFTAADEDEYEEG